MPFRRPREREDSDSESANDQEAREMNGDPTPKNKSSSLQGQGREYAVNSEFADGDAADPISVPEISTEVSESKMSEEQPDVDRCFAAAAIDNSSVDRG